MVSFPSPPNAYTGIRRPGMSPRLNVSLLPSPKNVIAVTAAGSNS